MASTEGGLPDGERPERPSSRVSDLENAAGTWADSEVRVCAAGPNTLVTSRKPDDLPAFCATFTAVFSRQSQPI
jgi:protease I